MNEHESEADDGNSAQKREWESPQAEMELKKQNSQNEMRQKSHQSEVEDDELEEQKLSHKERNY